MSKTDHQSLWFPREEFLSRIHRVQQQLRHLHLDGLLAFEPESVTYLTGYFTRGYSTFQFALIPLEGEPIVVCRDVEEYYLDLTCAFPGRALWSDSDDRLMIGAETIRKTFGAGARVGIEMSSWQLTAERYCCLRRLLPNIELVDAENMVGRMRLIKSPREIDYQRRAGKAAEAGMAAAAKCARRGISEREMAAEVTAAMIRAGSDLPGPGVLSSGERARFLHGGYGDRVLKRGDTVQVEMTPCVRHYHARFMRTIKVEEATSEDRKLAHHLIDIQDRALREVVPGAPASIADCIYREGVLKEGLEANYTNKTFYSVGLLLKPNGGEPLEAVPGSMWTFEPGMTFHTYILARSFGFSETIAITESGYERLTNYPRELIIS